MGWHGACVEPFPSGFETRGCQLVQRAIYPRSNEVVVFENVEQGRTVTGGLSTGQAEPWPWPWPPWRAAIGAAAAHRPLHARTISFTDLLITTGAPPFVNFISLDVEGQELPALQTFPFEKYEVGIWIVEHNHNEAQRAKIAEVLRAKGGYLRQNVSNPGVDDYYTHPTRTKYTPALNSKPFRTHPRGTHGC